jgi:hypothetical protein
VKGNVEIKFFPFIPNQRIQELVTNINKLIEILNYVKAIYLIPSPSYSLLEEEFKRKIGEICFLYLIFIPTFILSAHVTASRYPDLNNKYGSLNYTEDISLIQNFDQLKERIKEASKIYEEYYYKK